MLCSSELVISVPTTESQQQNYNALVSGYIVIWSTVCVQDGAEGHNRAVGDADLL